MLRRPDHSIANARRLQVYYFIVLPAQFALGTLGRFQHLFRCVIRACHIVFVAYVNHRGSVLRAGCHCFYAARAEYAAGRWSKGRGEFAFQDWAAACFF